MGHPSGIYILNCTRTPRRYDLLVRRGNDPEARKVAMVRRFHCPAACSFPAGVVACLASFRSVCLLPSMSTASFAVPWSLVASAQWLSSGFLMVFSNPKTLKSIVFCANSPYLAWMPPAYTAVYRATKQDALHLHPWRRAIQVSTDVKKVLALDTDKKLKIITAGCKVHVYHAHKAS